MPRRTKILSLKDLLVVIPHSGIIVPTEIPPDSLSEDFPATLRNVDWYTNWLYDFTDILDNQQIIFPYCSLLLEANRHPDIIDDCVPLRDVFGVSLYQPGQEPGFSQRINLSNRYLRTFHARISRLISSGAEFLLDGHSTIAARGVASRQIELGNYQHSALDDAPKYYSPSIYVETYAEELARRLPDVHITVNESEYYNVYGHVCAAHSVNALGRVGRQVPAVIQETCQDLYLQANKTPDVEAIDRLRRAFAESIHAAINKIRGLRKPPRMIELHNLRQTFDFDCGVKALQGVLAYYGVEEREDILLEQLGAERELGTNLHRMKALAVSRGFDVETGPNWTLEDIKRHLDQGRPVIVLMQAWSDTYLTLKEWRENYSDGHYVVAVGYDGPILYFEDPASFHRTWLKENEFLARWHDQDPVSGEKFIQVGLVLMGIDPVQAGVREME